MNNPHIVADDYTIINTQGIRYVEKIDEVSFGPNEFFTLAVTYKGDKLSHRYQDKAARDAQYEALRAVLLLRNAREFGCDGPTVQVAGFKRPSRPTL